MALDFFGREKCLESVALDPIYGWEGQSLTYDACSRILRASVKSVLL